MTIPLQTVSISAPGFFGLNTQESGVTLQPGFATQATNCVIDKFGRIGSRKGWVYRTDSLDGVAGDNEDVGLKGIHNYIDFSGSQTFLSWSDTAFYKGFDNLETLSPNTTSFTEGNWRAATLNDRVYFFQQDREPLYYTNETTPDEFEEISAHPDYTGNVPNAKYIISAYGRLWAAVTSTNKTTVFFSDLLDGVKWGSGSAGSINLAGIFSRDTDIITGIAAHNGFIIVFCQNSIAVFGDNDSFQGSFDVTSLQLVETIEGIGCIAGDTIVSTGSDILFLSSSGVRSLGRTIQEKSLPLGDLSKNIRDDLIRQIQATADLDTVKAVYSPESAFYLVTFPSSKFTYCFDTRVPLDDGALRVTLWDNQTHVNYLFDSVTRKLYFAEQDGIAEYFGFLDNEESYLFSYFSVFFDFGDSTVVKILKKIGYTVIGPIGQIFVGKVGLDFSTVFRSFPFELSTGVTFNYNEAEYSEAEYNLGLQIENVKGPIGGTGNTIQLGFETNINGAPMSIQRIEVFGKIGRLL